MDREKCLDFLRKAYGLTPPGGMNVDEMQELLESYVCDIGHADKKDYVPLFIKHPLREGMLKVALDYYRYKHCIYAIESQNPNGINSIHVLWFY